MNNFPSDFHFFSLKKIDGFIKGPFYFFLRGINWEEERNLDEKINRTGM